MTVVRTSKESATQLRMLERRAKVVELASQATPYRAIAAQVGCALSTVQADLADHWEETRPSTEVTERLRNLQEEEYAALRRRCYVLLASAEDVASELAIVDRIVRISEHRRRLHGMDVPVGIDVNHHVGTREWMAEMLWIEGQATEVVPGPRGPDA